MYAKIQNGSIVQYPFTQFDLQAQYPNASVPATWTPEFMQSEGIVHVVVTGAPLFDPAIYAPEEKAPEYVASRSRWEQVWGIRALTADELAQKHAQLQDAIVQAAQQRLDTFAQTRHYDGILSACTYASSPSAQFSAEGQCAVQARDATWSALYAVLAAVRSGTRPMPAGYADIEAELPVLAWP